MKNARNLANDNNNEIIEKVERVEVKTEKPYSPPAERSERAPQAVQLSPRSISDRLKQPKLQQKLSDVQAKSLSPEPPLSPVPQPQVNSQPDDRNKGVNFKLGKIGKQASEQEEPIAPQIQSPPQAEPQRSKQASTYNQSLKQRINNLVLKTLQENTGRERQNLLNHQTHSDSWKAKLFQNTRVICSVRECQMVIDDIMSKAAPRNGDQAWPFTPIERW
ncbi:hypothetical protein NQ318_005844 [Aromia moschata]|uniref:Uncharacterized protein n=1 Tax=Aromia moschata TaxID=1265417 RepID=A0AAV8YQQ7_9CUCU|nr:hypothetical protein NQ318_005844 [Aromia moschata]